MVVIITTALAAPTSTLDGIMDTVLIASMGITESGDLNILIVSYVT